MHVESRFLRFGSKRLAKLPLVREALDVCRRNNEFVLRKQVISQGVGNYIRQSKGQDLKRLHASHLELHHISCGSSQPLVICGSGGWRIVGREKPGPLFRTMR